jgi:hypothetical protein
MREKHFETLLGKTFGKILSEDTIVRGKFNDFTPLDLGGQEHHFRGGGEPARILSSPVHLSPRLVSRYSTPPCLGVCVTWKSMTMVTDHQIEPASISRECPTPTATPGYM